MKVPRLFHVSENGDIAGFEPRLPPSSNSAIDEPVVWAVEEARLVNYLLPRECPRVTFYAGEQTSAQDAARLLGPAGPSAVVAIESAWLERTLSATLFLYELPATGFVEIDPCAAYWVSRTAVTPLSVVTLNNCLRAVLERGVELRVMPSLWRLHEAVIASTLQFSCIRMRNAGPRHSS